MAWFTIGIQDGSMHHKLALAWFTTTIVGALILHHPLVFRMVQ